MHYIFGVACHIIDNINGVGADSVMIPQRYCFNESRYIPRASCYDDGIMTFKTVWLDLPGNILTLPSWRQEPRIYLMTYRRQQGFEQWKKAALDEQADSD
jgi:hypothetical protein